MTARLAAVSASEDTSPPTNNADQVRKAPRSRPFRARAQTSDVLPAYVPSQR